MAAAIGFALATWGTAAPGRFPVQRTASPKLLPAGGRPPHIAVIVMENEEYDSIVNSPSTPYINALARNYALAGEMFATSHPSLPNYLALTGGSTAGISSDCTDCVVGGGGLAGQLQRAQIPWKAYMEGLPRPCFLGAGSGGYAKKHDPFAYYTAVSGDRGQCQRIVPLSRLFADERAGTLPAFVWITPNLCHDMHNCSTATGDRFLGRLVPGLLRALGPHGLLFLTFDEGTTDNGCCARASGGHVATILAGGAARPHATMTKATDQYSVLQTIEDLFGLPRLRGAACPCTPSLAPLLGAAARGTGVKRR